MKEEKEIKNISDLIQSTGKVQQKASEGEKEYMQQQFVSLGLTETQKKEAEGQGGEFKKMEEDEKAKKYEEELRAKEKKEEMNVPAAPTGLEAEEKPEPNEDEGVAKREPNIPKKPKAVPQVPKGLGAAAGGKAGGSVGAGTPTGQRQGMAGNNIQQSATGERTTPDTRSNQRIEEGKTPKQKKAGGVVGMVGEEAKEAVTRGALQTVVGSIADVTFPSLAFMKVMKKLFNWSKRL